jgi:hypothetical protein
VTDETPWLRITFTAVELLEESGTRWLAVDFVDDIHGQCDRALPWETTLPGFTGEVRTTAFIKENPDSPPVRHQRARYRMPDSIERSRLESFRSEVEAALRLKSFRLGLEEKRLLFEFPGPDGGSFKAWVRAAPPLPVPTGHPDHDTPTSDETANLRIRIARDQVDIARQRQAIGLISAEQVAEAELQLAIAEARGDAIAAARAHLNFADNALTVTRKKFEVGLVASHDLKAAENRRALAEAELKAALQRTTAAARP